MELEKNAGLGSFQIAIGYWKREREEGGKRCMYVVRGMNIRQQQQSNEEEGLVGLGKRGNIQKLQGRWRWRVYHFKAVPCTVPKD